MSNFAVPKELQKFVLSVGITVALVLRGMFILVGAAIISRFTWVFFLFGAFLIVTAIKLVAGGDEDEEYQMCIRDRYRWVSSFESSTSFIFA